MRCFAYIVISLSLVLAACQSHSRLSEAIAAADAVVCQYPDSALAILNGADTVGAPARLMAHYALLREKATDKAYLINRDDSLISFAADYYLGRGDSLEAQALYYAGVVQLNKGDFGHALISLMQAHEVSDQVGDLFYKAMSSRTLADVYNELLSYDAAAKADSMAIVEFYEAGRPKYAKDEEINRALYLIHSNRYDEVDKIFLEYDDTSVINKSQSEKSWYYQLRALNLFSQYKYQEALEWYDSCILTNPEYVPSINWSRAAICAIKIGNSRQAAFYLDNAISKATDAPDSLFMMLAKSKLLNLNGEHEKAFDLQDSVYGKYNIRNNALLTHPYTTLLTEHLSTQSKQRLEFLKSARASTLYWIIIALLLSISIIFGIVLYIRKKRMNEIVIENLLRDIKQLERDKQPAISSDEDPTKEDPIFSDSYINVVDRLFTIALTIPEASNSEHQLKKVFENLVANIGNGQFISHIEYLLNIRHDNIVEKFKTEVDNLTEKQINYFILFVAGFSTTSIYYFAKISTKNALNQLRARIKNNILKSEPLHQEEFIKILKLK